MDFINAKLANLISYVINPILSLLLGVAVVVFVYGVWEYFFKDVEGKDRSKGANHILWGVVGFTIMLSAFGIINIILNTTGTGDEFDLKYRARTPINTVQPK
ncbi:MAG: hypothetical protein Q7R78_01560 [bacterium]|nr:hypothetical protein [bacterium]